MLFIFKEQTKFCPSWPCHDSTCQVNFHAINFKMWPSLEARSTDHHVDPINFVVFNNIAEE